MAAALADSPVRVNLLPGGATRTGMLPGTATTPDSAAAA
jgi:hypothetical protein